MTDGEKYAFALSALRAILTTTGNGIARNAIEYLENK